MDLFAGCGGMSLGFDRAGFRCVSAVEIDDDARNSHRKNFEPRASGTHYRAYRDITATEPEDAVAHLTNLPIEKSIDIITGGFPCQAFSRLGRAALWQLAKEKNAHFNDPRATMYEYFIKYVMRLRPVAFVIENVREIGNFNHKNLAHELAETMEEVGYNTRYTILNAVWYGVPQLRERMIIVGIDKSLRFEPHFPPILHDYKLPVGYSTARAGKNHFHVLPPFDFYVDHYELAEDLIPAVTAAHAFADLPVIKHHLDGRTGKGHPRDTNESLEYKKGIDNPFLRMMKDWPGFESNGNSCGHVVRYTPRDYEIFRRMPHGGMYPEALQTAEQIFHERLKTKEVLLGHRIRKHSKLWDELRKQIVPPYKVDRYPNKFRKMWAEHPVRTVPAHIGKDSYSHIHFDSKQARCISLREAARLQSFPDAFQLAGGMNSQLKQIGNAVPPLLAFAVATTLKEILSGKA